MRMLGKKHGRGPGAAGEEQEEEEEEKEEAVSGSMIKITGKELRDRECKEVLALYERGIDVFRNLQPPAMQDIDALDCSSTHSLASLERATWWYGLQRRLASSAQVGVVELVAAAAAAAAAVLQRAI